MPDAASRPRRPAVELRLDSIRVAASLLKPTRRVLVAGLGGVSTEAQRLAVAIADRLGGVADWTTSPADAAPMLALQSTGAATATFGEVAERADLVVRWRCDASEQVPGLADGPTAVSVPGDRAPLAAGADYEALSVLRALAKGVEPDAAAVIQQTGVDLGAWQSLCEQVLAAHNVAFVVGSSTHDMGAAFFAALTLFVQETADRVRAHVVSPATDDNRHGANTVLAWQTGCPMAVDFGRGYPRYLPGECATQTLLERGEVDAALLLDSLDLPPCARRHLSAIPTVLLTDKTGDKTANIHLRVTPLTSSGGAYYRSDGVALRYPRTTGDLPTAAAVLAALLEEFGDG